MSKIYILNQFVKTVPLNKKFILLYNPLVQNMVVIDRQELILFNNGFIKKNDKYNELIKNEILQDINTDNIKYFNKRKCKIINAKNPGIHVMYLVLNSFCNLNCNYCFVKKNFNNTSLTKSQIEKALLLFKNQKSPLKKRIILYGGEPLLNFTLLEFTLRRIKDIFNEDAKITLITNGINLNNSNFSLLKEYNVSVGLSLDGFGEKYNKNRVDLNNKCAYIQIKKTYDFLISKKYPFGISCTISEDNVADIKKFVKKLNPRVSSFSYNLLLRSKLKYPENFVNNLFDVLDILSKNKITEDRIYSRRVLSLVKNNYYIKDCAGLGNQIVVAKNGNIGICHGYNWNHEVYFPHNIDTINANYDFSKDYVWNIWNKRSTLNMPCCINCVGLTLCGGGCAANKTEGELLNIYTLDSVNCLIYKRIITTLLKKIGLKMIKDKKYID